MHPPAADDGVSTCNNSKLAPAPSLGGGLNNAGSAQKKEGDRIRIKLKRAGVYLPKHSGGSPVKFPTLTPEETAKLSHGQLARHVHRIKSRERMRLKRKANKQ
jgi:hypothetical protein